MPDWEPAPPSAAIGELIDALVSPNAPSTASVMAFLCNIARDVAAMERRLAEYARKERADAE